MTPVRSFDDLMETAHGYQRSMALFVALKLGVFSALERGSADAATVARRVGADPRRLAVLLDVLTAMGLLRKTGGRSRPRGPGALRPPAGAGRYRNGDVAAAFLAGGPRSRASILLHHRDCWRDWSRLEETVRDGRKGRPPGGDEHENFIRGMEDNARERAARVAARFRLRAGERLLDLGGGPGTYAVAWARRYPGASVTLFDTGGTVRITRRILDEKGAAGAIRLVEGDFFADPIGGPYDFVWISQILHAFSDKDCLALLRKARKALAPGGRVAVQEFILDEGRTGPPAPAFFSLHMVAVTDGGHAYTAGDIAAMMKAAGLGRVSTEPPDPRGVGIVVGRG